MNIKEYDTIKNKIEVTVDFCIIDNNYLFYKREENRNNVISSFSNFEILNNKNYLDLIKYVQSENYRSINSGYFWVSNKDLENIENGYYLFDQFFTNSYKKLKKDYKFFNGSLEELKNKNTNIYDKTLFNNYKTNLIRFENRGGFVNVDGKSIQQPIYFDHFSYNSLKIEKNDLNELLINDNVFILTNVNNLYRKEKNGQYVNAFAKCISDVFFSFDNNADFFDLSNFSFVFIPSTDEFNQIASFIDTNEEFLHEKYMDLNNLYDEDSYYEGCMKDFNYNFKAACAVLELGFIDCLKLKNSLNIKL